MRRIAYASPVNPAPSGISDYSEELLPYLGQHADLTLYLDDGLRPGNPNLSRYLEVRPLSRLERDHRRQPFDAILYHLGNSPAHGQIWRTMQHVPGVVVMHDFVLHHFMLQYLVAVQGKIDLYRSEALRRYGAEGERVANLMLRGRFTEVAFDLPFCEDVLDIAHGVITHSRYVLDRVMALRPDLPGAHVPMGVPLPPLIARDVARARLGLPIDAFVLASFGHINPYKRVDAVLRALRDLRVLYPNIRYVLVGSVSPSYDVRSAVARAGLEEVVMISGYVERDVFEGYVAAADICVNLRHPTAGETSASLLRLLGAGKPTLVTASGSFVELPPGVVAQVDPDASEGDLILAYCRLLRERPDVANALGAAARTYVAREHTLEGAAAGYMRFLAQRYGWGAGGPLRAAPLWNVEREESVSARPIAPVARRDASVQVEEAPKLAGPMGVLVPAVAEALAGMGVTEQDTALLAGTARALAELGAAPVARPR